MNKIGIFMNFWEKNWAADHEKYIRKVAAMGFDVLEFQAQPLLEMSDGQMQRIKAVADEVGIELTYSLGLDPKYDISSADPAVRKGGIRYLQDIVRRVHQMKGAVLSGVNYAGWGAPNYILEDKTPLWDRSLACMAEIIKVAEDCGVMYCLEAVNRFEGCLLNTAAEALAYVQAVGSPHISILLDTYHMNIEETSIGDAIRLAGKHLGGFHTGENNRTAPGRGHLDWAEIFGALHDIGYQGRIVSEPFLMMGGEVGRDIKVWRSLIENPTEERIDAEARYLLGFTKEMLRKAAEA